MFTDPVKNLKALGLREDMVLADLGAGSGFYALAAAQILSRGKVYAVEIQEDFLITLRNKASELGLYNLECFLGNIEKLHGTKIKDSVLDVVVASNVLFQLEEREEFIGEINRILKKGGKLLLIDWSEVSPMLGANANRIVKKEEAEKMFSERGFSKEKEIDAGEHHYGIIFIKN